MKKNRKISILCFCCFLVLLLDVASLYVVDDAYAVLGVRRRTARRTAVVVGSAGAASTAAAQQQATASQQQAAQAQAEADAAKAETAAAQQQAAAAEQQAAAAQAPHAAPGPLPIGTITTALPPGCTTTVVDNVQYYNDGTNYYRAVFQGSQLVYVTAQP